MPSLPLTPATTSYVPKHAREEGLVGSSKRQRHNELQTSPEHFSNFAINYPQIALNQTSGPSSPPPPVLPAYPTIPSTHLQNAQGTATGYEASQDGLYDLSHTNNEPNEHCGLDVSPQPLPVPQLSYGYPGYVYQHHANGQSTSTMQAMYAPGLLVTQAPRDHERHFPMHPSMIASTPRQQQQTLEQTLEQKLSSALYAPEHCQNDLSSTTAEQAAWERLHVEQDQWLIKAKADLQDRNIMIVPAIPINQGTVGASVRIKDDLLPSDMWHLRALSPFLRYGAYRVMTEVAREMVMYDQASEEYQTRWARIVKLRAHLMQVERAWANSFTQGTAADNRERWNQTVKEQAVEVPVDQAMVDEFDRSRSKARATSLIDMTMGNETPQAAPSKPVLAEKEPATKKKTIQKLPDSAAQPVAAPVVVIKPVKPDTIKHPSDKTAVPKYPSDEIKDFSPNPITGRYRCMHEFETNWRCCKEGLDERRMKQAISRSISTWKSRVEVLIKEGRLHRSHMTWKTYQNAKLRKLQIVAEEKRAEEEARDGGVGAERRAKEEEEQEQQKHGTIVRAKVTEREKQRQRWLQEPHEADALSEPASVPVSDSPRQHDATAPELSRGEVAAPATLPVEIATAVRRYEREYNDSWYLENQKKWPNWPRFNEWWAARGLQVRCSQLSPKQNAILKGPEPSGITDKDPEFVKKTKEPPQSQVQELEEVDENVGLDESSLNDLFEDDRSELEKMRRAKRAKSSL